MHMAFRAIFVASVCLLVSAKAVSPTLVRGIRILGHVFCTVDNNAVDPLHTPTFPNATVVLQCGSENTTIVSARTNNAGAFHILLDPSISVASSIESDCRLVVTTPLANCNAALSPTRTLSSELLFLLTLIGDVVFDTYVPRRFMLKG
ncbi:phylloplanin-like [Prunus yedoensis var. nudiflora]|uniref:Phylloplanin-like n=1 Tax=Prunus yedoensis var. nudiflora TaxID=2094558 RepID=A0A314Y5F8_PRUYE|nr:phylloplanin-like [Prunus yedoensis var. nudiflora]